MHLVFLMYTNQLYFSKVANKDRNISKLKLKKQFYFQLHKRKNTILYWFGRTTVRKYHSGWSNKFIFCLFCTLESKIKVLVSLIPSERWWARVCSIPLSSSCWFPGNHCCSMDWRSLPFTSYVVFNLCVCLTIFPFHKSTSDTGLKPSNVFI